MKMRTRVKKWGNSLALRIPRSFAREVGLEQDSSVEVSVAGGKLVIEPVAQSKWTLERLLAQVTDDNLHREVDTGPAVGSETW
jgi:antitoxin MazE